MALAIGVVAWLLVVAFLVKFFQAIHRWDEEIRKGRENGKR
jgi:hypothetical protein